MKKILKGLGFGLMALSLALVGGVQADAALTLGATTVTTDGAYTLNGVAGSVYGIGAATVGGTIAIGGTAQTGAITLGSSTAAQTVNIGTGTGAISTVNVATAGATGNVVNVATGAFAGTVTIGNVTGATAIVLNSGTSGVAVTTTGAGDFTVASGDDVTINGVAASDYTIGAATVGGTISIGGTAGTGAISLGVSTAAQTINIGTGDAAGVITIGDNTGAAVSSTVRVAGSAITANGPVNYVLDTGAADVYVATFAPAITAYATGLEIHVKIANVNATTTPTINVNALGAKVIVKRAATALAAGDLPAGAIAVLIYDGTNFQLINPVVN